MRQIKGFGGLNFGPGIFGGFCLKPEGSFGVLIVPPIRSSLSLEIWSTAPLACMQPVISILISIMINSGAVVLI